MAIDEFIGDFEVSREGSGADLRIRMVNRIRGTTDGEGLKLIYSLSPDNDLYFVSEPQKNISRDGVLNKKETEVLHRTRLVRGKGSKKAFIFIDVEITDAEGSVFTRAAKLIL